MIGRKSISPALFTEVNHHKRNNGPGMYVPIKKPHRRNVKFRLGEIQALAEFLDCYCTKTALTRSVISDNGETILIPLVYKTVSTERLVSLFFKARAKEKIQTGEIAASFVIGTRHSNTKITISHEKVRNIVNYLAPGNLQCLTCLDSMSQRDGAENFVNMKRIINYLQNSIVDSDANLEMLASKALNIIAKAELFAKSRENGIWTNAHAKGNRESKAGPECHCHFFLFGKRDHSVEVPPPGASPAMCMQVYALTVKFCCKCSHHSMMFTFVRVT
jgi:hypothetical protein